MFQFENSDCNAMFNADWVKSDMVRKFLSIFFLINFVIRCVLVFWKAEKMRVRVILEDLFPIRL